MRSLQTIGTVALAIAVFATFAVDTASAQSKTADETGGLYEQGGGRIDGSWDVLVTIRDCQSGNPIRTFASVTTFNAGGTLMDSTSGIPQSLKTPGQGVWSHVQANTYRFKFKSFSFDGTGNYAGSTIITHTAYLDWRANHYESEGTSEIYSPTGVLVFTGCSTTVADRFQL